LTEFFNSAKEECPIFDDGPAKASTKIILAQFRLGADRRGCVWPGVKWVPGVERIVLEKFEQ
jgi:hypothetical protein